MRLGRVRHSGGGQTARDSAEVAVTRCPAHRAPVEERLTDPRRRPPHSGRQLARARVCSREAQVVAPMLGTLPRSEEHEVFGERLRFASTNSCAKGTVAANAVAVLAADYTARHRAARHRGQIHEVIEYFAL